MLISIIIPLHNLEKYIGKCIRSAVAQDLPADRYEVLVIDDGSTDDSFRAACRAAEGHANVRVFPRPNAGVSEARNYGIAESRGRYLIFLDADDTLRPDTLGKVAALVEREELDMLCVRIRAVDKNGTVLPYWSDRIYDRLPRGIVRGTELLRENLLFPMVPAYIYRRDFLLAHALRMLPIRHEDEDFTPRALYYARRVGYLPDPFYEYLQRADSFMGNYDPQQVFHIIPAMQHLASFARQREEEGDAEGARLIRCRIGICTFLLCKRSVRRRYGNTRELIDRLHEAGLFPLTFRRRKFRYMLLNASPRLFVAYYRLHTRKK